MHISRTFSIWNHYQFTRRSEELSWERRSVLWAATKPPALALSSVADGVRERELLRPRVLLRSQRRKEKRREKEKNEFLLLLLLASFSTHPKQVPFFARAFCFRKSVLLRDRRCWVNSGKKRVLRVVYLNEKKMIGCIVS